MRNTAEIMQEIEQLPGMEEFKSLCRRVRTASENASRLLAEKPPVPNLIFAAAPGSGVTLHIRLLSELLASLRLVQFTGEEDYFEWELTDKPNAFDQFLLRVKAAGGFYGQFRGVVGLDLSSAIRSGEALPDMDRLMEYVNAQQGRIVFIFILPDRASSRTVSELLGRFASVTPAELIHMPFPAAEAKSFIARKLTDRGFRLTKKASDLLEEVVTRLSASKEFEGYQTLVNLTEAIIWRRLSGSAMKSTSIGEDDLAFIFADNGYCSQLNANARNTPRRQVGFGASKEE